jgi:hypothetical protein
MGRLRRYANAYFASTRARRIVALYFLALVVTLWLAIPVLRLIQMLIH